MSRVRLTARVCSILASIASFAGWLTMRRTEAAILSSKANACDLVASVTLKGHQYLTCSSLAARYHAGEGVFLTSWLILLGSIIALKMHKP